MTIRCISTIAMLLLFLACQKEKRTKCTCASPVSGLPCKTTYYTGEHVDSVMVFVYSETRMTGTDHYDSNNKKTATLEITYGAGNRTVRTDLYRNKHLDSYTEYSYNDFDSLTSSNAFNNKDELLSKLAYNYDHLKRRVSLARYNGSAMTDFFTYNYEGSASLPWQINHHNPDSSLRTYKTYENFDNNLARITGYDSRSVSIGYDIVAYENKRVMTIFRYNSDKTLDSYVEYEYLDTLTSRASTYDGNGARIAHYERCYY